MLFRLLLILTLSMFLYACSSDEVKEEIPVEVEDLSMTAADIEEDDVSGATAYGVDEDESYRFSELRDLQSQLSVRVIYFDYDSSEVRSDYRLVVEAHTRYLIENPSTTIILEGHADERGSREYNLALGERRAQSVKQQMTLLGAASSQIRLVSYGEERSAVDGHDEASWQQNRRVEILY